MGRGNKKKSRNRGGGGGARSGGNYHARGNYRDLPRENERFERYYNELGVLPESERAEFWNALRRDLPNSFRFTGSKSHALAVQQKLIDYFIPKISSVTYEGQLVDPPKPVPWYPANLAWVMTTPKQVIRKFPPFAEFQKFLVSENGVGNISRQELVSMIPPLLMDVRPGMAVLDMCAAPGSKSAQLIEMIHDGEENRIRSHSKEQNGNDETFFREADEDWSDNGRATGLLIANDNDQRRAQLLVHQTKRLNSPNVIITNHDASNFPSIRIPAQNNRATYLKFDRILADVPCSGDGTCRKNVNVWHNWVPGNAIGLHNLQYRILVRALQMLKVGGRVVYSTCSMNPLEDEAVVAAAIEQSGGLENVQLVDCSNKLVGLKRVSGLTSWKVMDRQFKFWNSWEEVESAVEKGEWENSNQQDAVTRLSKSMFPPGGTGDERISLERCMRVYPHLQDTGGFFIAVLEKVSEIKPKLPAPQVLTKSSDIVIEKAAIGNEDEANGTGVEDGEGEASASNGVGVKRPAEDEINGGHKKSKVDVTESNIANLSKEETKNTTLEPRGPDLNKSLIIPNKVRSHQVQEEPFKYLPEDHAVLQNVYEFYTLSPEFPRDRFMVRNATGDPAKAIYYTSALVRDILTLNEGKGMKFVYAGVKMFMKQDVQGQNTCPWRIQTDGISLVESWISKSRVIRLTKRDTLQRLLREMFIKVSGDSWMVLGEIGPSVRDMGMGCAVLVVESSPDDPDGFKERMVMPLWRSISSVNIMLPKEERKAYLLRLYNDETALIDHSRIIANRKEAEKKNCPAEPEDYQTSDDGSPDNGDVDIAE